MTRRDLLPNFNICKSPPCFLSPYILLLSHYSIFINHITSLSPHHTHLAMHNPHYDSFQQPQDSFAVHKQTISTQAPQQSFETMNDCDQGMFENLTPLSYPSKSL